MQDLLEICCGIDVHKNMVVACLLKGDVDKKPTKEIREFSTLMYGLEELCNWLLAENCYAIAMESTGVYWYTVYNILEAGFEDMGVQLIVTNPRHMKNVPGKKTDMKDAEWIATLLRAGLLKSSYVPPRDIRELRDLTRYRRNMVQETAVQKNRIEKFLQQCGFKISSFISDICGLSGMTIIEHLYTYGKISPEEIVNMLHGKVRNKTAELQQAVNGTMSKHQQEFLKILVEWYKQGENHVNEVEEKIMACATKYREKIDLICTIPAIQELTAITIISEVGVDLRMFPTASHFSSWAGLCPGNNESAGKRKSGRLLKGNPYLKSVLCQCAWGSARSRKSYLHDWFWKLKQRRGSKKAVVAVAHKLLVFIYSILKNNDEYDEGRHEAVKIAQDNLRRKKLIAEAKQLGLILM